GDKYQRESQTEYLRRCKSGYGLLNNNLRTFTCHTLNKFSRRCTQCRACIVEVEQFFRDLAGYVTRPAFFGVECDRAQRTLELAFNHPADNGWLVGFFVAKLSPDAAISTKIVKNLINRMIVHSGHNAD